MPIKKGSGKKKKGSGKKKRKATSKKKKIGPQPPLLIAEVGLRSRQFLDYQVEDQRNLISRLQEKLDAANAEFNVLKETSTVATRQIGDDRDYLRHELDRLSTSVNGEREKFRTKTVDLENQIEKLKDDLNAAEKRRSGEVAELSERLVVANQKLGNVEQFRKEQSELMTQLHDAEKQIKDMEESFKFDIEQLERKAAENESFLYKEGEQKLARVAKALRNEAVENLDSRSSGAVSENKRLREKVDQLNQKLFSMIAANKSIKDKSAAVKRNLIIETDTREALTRKYRKSQKIIAKLRDSLNTETEKSRLLTEEKEKTIGEHQQTEALLIRHIEVLQSTVEATEITVDSEGVTAVKKPLPEAVLKNMPSAINWANSAVESIFLKQAKGVRSNELVTALGLQLRESKKVLGLLQSWVSKAIESEKGQRLKIGAAQDLHSWKGAKIANVRTIGTMTEPAQRIHVSKRNEVPRKIHLEFKSRTGSKKFAIT